jgi:hypothetical protein
MSSIKISTSRKDETTHTVILNRAALDEVIARSAAEAVGVDLAGAGVTYVVHLQVSVHGASEAVVRITTDYTKLPQVSA